jgi:hypothetical protein
MESLNTDFAPEGVKEESFAMGAAATPIEPMTAVPVVNAAPFETLNHTIGVFEKLCVTTGAAKLRTKLRIRVPKLHTLVGKLTL